MAVSRRDIIQLTASALITAASSVTVFTTLQPSQKLTASQLVQTLDNPHAAAEIGATFLSSRAEPQAEIFRAALSAKLTARGIGPKADPQAIKDAMSQLIRSDFAGGNLTDIEGWMLARSEAELCALAALTLGHV